MMSERTTESLRFADPQRATKLAPEADYSDSATGSLALQAGGDTSISLAPSALRSAAYSLNHHWPEYLMEAWGLGLFMLSACAFGALLEHPASPVHQAIPDRITRMVLMGAAMALTNIVNIYSPWGKRSGAHLNPAVTWTFFRLGKVEVWDAVFYSLSQFAGAILGVLIARLVLMNLVAHPAVNFVATVPGAGGIKVAFAAELFISFILMAVVLRASNSARLNRFTGLFASALVMTYISVEAPLSGMSMNPARTFGSAFFADAWAALWIYFTAPPLGMLLAAETYLRLLGARKIFCAKLHHHNSKRCIFRCSYGELSPQSNQQQASGWLPEQ